MIKGKSIVFNPIVATAYRLYNSMQMQGEHGTVGSFPDPAMRVLPLEKHFDRRMKEAGFIRQQAWSAWLIETLLSHTYATHTRLAQRMQQVYSGSPMDMHRLMHLSGLFTSEQMPEPGYIAFWRYGNSWMGMAGLVMGVSQNETHFTSLEAHNHLGESDSFFIKTKNRRVCTKPNPYGMQLIEFLKPPSL